MRAQQEVVTPNLSEARNLVDLLVTRAQEPSGVGALVKRNGKWEEVSWGTLLAEVKRISAGLVAMGVQPGDRVAVFGATMLQWVLCDLGISAAGGITVPIYASNTPDECKYILNNSGAALLFVDNDEKDAKQIGRLSRIRQRLEDCPQLKQVVVMEGAAGSERETTLAQLLEKGDAHHRANPAAFDERRSRIKREDVSMFIYTSGTTGEPKGVMLTHGNWAFEAEVLQKMGVMRTHQSLMLFLPLAHVFAQVIKASWLGIGYKLIFAESVDKLLANVGETQPTIFPSVPRVFEKIYNNVVSTGTSAPGVKGRLFRWALKLFDEYVEARSQGVEYASLSFALAKRLVFGKVAATLNEKLGGKLQLFISGGAPLSRKIGYFFEMLGFIVLEGYGLTETSAAAAINLPEKAKIGTVGPPVPGTEIKIAPDGEILIRGPHIMKGYYKNQAATDEVLQKDGWFHSGDIGELDPDNYLRITDRKKDIIVNAGGKNIAPQNLENALKTYPIVSQVVVHGDKRPYLVALVCVNEESARKLLAEKGVQAGSYAEIAGRPEVRQAIQAAIDQLNAEQPPYASIKKIAVMDHDFTQETGELTPTLKVKRKYCNQRYKDILDGLYGEALN